MSKEQPGVMKGWESKTFDEIFKHAKKHQNDYAEQVAQLQAKHDAKVSQIASESAIEEFRTEVVKKLRVMQHAWNDKDMKTGIGLAADNVAGFQLPNMPLHVPDNTKAIEILTRLLHDCPEKKLDPCMDSQDMAEAIGMNIVRDRIQYELDALQKNEQPSDSEERYLVLQKHVSKNLLDQPLMLSEVDFNEKMVGLRVLSADKTTKGIVTAILPTPEEPDYDNKDWVTIHWLNGNKTDAPRDYVTKVEVL